MKIKCDAETRRFIARHFAECQGYLTEIPTTPEGAEEAAAVIAGALRRLTEGPVKENRGLSDTEQAAYDTLEEALAEAESYKVVRTLKVRQQPGAQPGASPAGEAWTDRGGREIRLLRPDEPFAEVREHRPLDVSFGAYCRALALGPRTEAEERVLSEGTTSAGGYTVPTPLAGNFIDRLRAKAVLFQAGATTVPMDSATLSIARLDTDPVAAWRAENAALSNTDPAFSSVTLTARSIYSLVRASQELVEDSINLERILMKAFINAFDLELTRVALLGSGTPPEPQGLRTLSGVNEVSMGAAAGGALTGYTQLLALVQAMAAANCEPPTALIMAPREFFTLQTLMTDAGGWLAAPDALHPLLGGYAWQTPQTGVPASDKAGRPAWLMTNAVPVNENFGTASPMIHTASTIFAGHFPEMFIGIRHEIRIEVLRELFAGNHQIGFKAYMRADVQVAHPASFGRLVGIKP